MTSAIWRRFRQNFNWALRTLRQAKDHPTLVSIGIYIYIGFKCYIL